MFEWNVNFETAGFNASVISVDGATTSYSLVYEAEDFLFTGWQAGSIYGLSVSYVAGNRFSSYNCTVPPSTTTAVCSVVTSDTLLTSGSVYSSTTFAGDFATVSGVDSAYTGFAVAATGLVRIPIVGGLEKSSTPKPSGLSLGAKIAIGVVIPLFIIAIIALLLFQRRRRQRQRLANTPMPTMQETNEEGAIQPNQKAELEGSTGVVYGNTAHTKPELGASTDAVSSMKHFSGTTATTTDIHELRGYPASSAGTPSIAELRTHPDTVGAPSIAELAALRSVAEMSEHQLLQDQRVYEETPYPSESREAKAKALAQLEARKAKIAAERERISRLERLDEEERRVEEEMARLRDED